MKRNQSGFTLIEIAIVLVIIGLLLGGVLKGQELINSAKVKNLIGDFKNIPVSIYGYQDKYKASPGDDLLALTHLSLTAGTGAGSTVGAKGDGNGIIDGKWDSTTNTDESFNFWQHIRLAGFGPGPTDRSLPDYIPKNALGGSIGVTNVAEAPVAGMKGTYIICSGGIAGKFAKQIDATLDDGNSAAGTILIAGLASTNTTAAVSSPLDDTPYIVCMGF